MKGSIKGRDSPPYTGNGSQMAKGVKMTNEDVIINLSRQLQSVAGRIADIAAGMKAMQGARPTVCGNYEGFLFDEVAHVQILALDLTQVVTEGEEGNGDEAFGPGELTDETGKEQEAPPEEEAE